MESATASILCLILRSGRLATAPRLCRLARRMAILGTRTHIPTVTEAIVVAKDPKNPDNFAKGGNRDG